MAGHNSKTEEIIIVKKVVKHGGGHHGGAWKVAYADFVTAMMALFIVLWLLSASEKVKKAVGGYFNDPTGKGRQTGTTRSGTGEMITLKKDDINDIKKRIEEAMAKEMKDFDNLRDHVRVTVTEEGLRIELTESDKGVFFEIGRPVPSPTGARLFIELAKELGGLPNLVIIEGHTDAKPFGAANGYSNWELSVDRANSVRRLMHEHGLRDNQVIQVRGYADQQLRKPEAPQDPSNRRISILVRRVPEEDSPDEVPPAGGEHAGEHAKEGETKHVAETSEHSSEHK